ncbi:hypothetical protein KSNIM_37835 [Kitasatospora sp. DSM 101779]|nr:hypothetical protein [Kitasatospora sp. DSM 101779]
MLIAIVMAVLFSMVIASVAGALTKMDGKSWPSALLFTGAAFGGSMLLCLAVLTLYAQSHS